MIRGRILFFSKTEQYLIRAENQLIWWWWFISYIALHHIMLLALYDCWNMNLYRLFFTQTNIHKTVIVRASTISFTPKFHAQWGGSCREVHFKSLVRPAWCSNTCFHRLVTSALDHYATIWSWATHPCDKQLPCFIKAGCWW